MKIGFDNDKYLKMQSEHIRERIGQFGNKLYLEFGGKLFDDYHASRVLPGFEPDSKLRMLMQLSDQAEIVIVISANDIDKNKVRGDLGITYDEDVLRLMDEFTSRGLYVGSVCITQYSGQESADLFKKRLEKLGIRVYKLYLIPGYPSNTSFIVSDEGYGKNDYIETTRPLVVITAPGPGSGKMATCLSQLYHEYKRGVKAGYAKFETFPIWNLPLKHPVNLAYEAATADLNDVNMIDPFHLEAYGKTTVNYNRDVEVFPVVQAMFEKIMGSCPYNLRQIWVLTWQATVSLMMKYARKLPVRRSSAAITRAWTLWFPVPVQRMKYARSNCSFSRLTQRSQTERLYLLPSKKRKKPMALLQQWNFRTAESYVEKLPIFSVHLQLSF